MVRFVLSEPEKTLLPSDEDVRFYQDHGWYLSQPLLSEQGVDALAEAADRYWRGHRDRRLPVRPPHIEYWEPSHGDVSRNNDYIFYEDDTFGSVLSKPIIGAVAARLAGTDQIRLLQSTLRYKPPDPDDPTSVIPWHYDKGYWKTHTSHNLLTAFIPLHDCDEEMGTITMVDRSHTWKGDGSTSHLPFHQRDSSELDADLERHATMNGALLHLIPMRIKKGHMSFHHCRTYHGSGPNKSRQPRRAISLHFQDRENRWQEHRTSTGTLLVYPHDVLVRRTPKGDPDYSDPTFCPVLWEGSL